MMRYEDREMLKDVIVQETGWCRAQAETLALRIEEELAGAFAEDDEEDGGGEDRLGRGRYPEGFWSERECELGF